MNRLNKKSDLPYEIKAYQELIRIEDEIEEKILNKIYNEIRSVLTTSQNALYDVDVNIYIDKIILTLTSKCYNNIEIDDSQLQEFKKIFYHKTENILVKIESNCDTAKFIFKEM